MTKTPLIERMAKGGAAKTWIKEVDAKNRLLERRKTTIDEYGNYIDQLVTHYQEATYQIGRAIAQLSEPYIKTPVDEIEVKLTVMSVVAQLTMYIEGEK